MKHLSLFTIILSLLFSSCGDSGGSGDGSVTTSDASTPTSFPSGTILAFNPVLTFSFGELTNDGREVSVHYLNDDGRVFPLGDGNVDVSMKDLGNGKLQLEFEIGGVDISLELDDFTDVGGDGYTDTFTITATVGGTVQASSTGQFAGGAKPINHNVSPLSRTDITGAPTENEFKDSLVGYAILVQNAKDEDVDFIYFRDGENVEFYDDDYEESYGTYRYTEVPGTNDKGTLNLIQMNEKPENNTWESTVTLTFTNFYEGGWVENERTWNNNPSEELGSGTFTVFYGTSMEDLKGFLE